MRSSQIEHITQPTGNTCVATCIAMILGWPVEMAIEYYHEDYFVNQSIQIEDILNANGVPCQRQMAGQVQRLMPGNVYLLTVASLNIPGALHCVIVNYRDRSKPIVLDPAKGYGNRKYYTADSIEASEVPEAFEIFSWIVDYIL